MKTALLLALTAGAISAQIPFIPDPLSPIYVPPDLLTKKPVTGIPYSGARMSSQSSPSGVPQQPWLDSREYRDSAGRIRSERYAAGTQTPTVVTIIEPAAHVRYILDVQNRIAHRQYPTRDIRPPAWDWPDLTSPEYIDPSTIRPPLLDGKKIGTQVIAGVKVQGVRYTSNGKYYGSRGKSIEEVWSSKELRITFLSRIAYQPWALESTQILVDLKREEPAPALLQVPADYRIVDDSFQLWRPLRE